MIEINAKTPSKLADDVESWLRTLPSFDAGEAIERVGSEVADLIPGRRRSRLAGLAGWAIPAVVVGIAVATIATLWALSHRSPTPDRYGLEEMVPDAVDFDRDAGIRAASEGMQAPDLAGTPANDTDLGAL